MSPVMTEPNDWPGDESGVRIGMCSICLKTLKVKWTHDPCQLEMYNERIEDWWCKSCWDKANLECL